MSADTPTESHTPVAAGEHTDQTGYNAHYKEFTTGFEHVGSSQEYITEFESRFATPFADGGWVFDGEPLAHIIRSIDEFAERRAPTRSEVRILDAGSGVGRTSVYFACKGYDVHGVEISEAGVRVANELKKQIDLPNCTFVASSLVSTGLPDNSVDVFFGRNTLHHFIKYEGVAEEFRRIAKPGAIGLFMDPFGENFIKNLFHDKEKMERLGDVLLTKKNIEEFFAPASVEIIPFSWVSMLDKLYVKHLVGWRRSGFARRLARYHRAVDHKVPKRNRMALWLAGMAVTSVKYI